MEFVLISKFPLFKGDQIVTNDEISNDEIFYQVTEILPNFRDSFLGNLQCVRLHQIPYLDKEFEVITEVTGYFI